MAVVYRARDRRLNRPVALKILPPELAYDLAVRTRFTREAQTAAQLAHPHIVPIYDVGERDGIAYFVMAEVTGGNLGALLANDPRPPLDEVRRLLCEIADALGYAHSRGVIHRDIKPDNILLDGETGRAMVSDFGIARAIEASGRLTLTGSAVGTPTYMSPEQATGDRIVDGRSDIYSLGVLGYQMLVGRVPFAAGNAMALMLKQVSERPIPIAELRPDTPRSLQDAVERALLKSPEDRWPTAMAMRDMLLVNRSTAAPWRAAVREPVRFTSPLPHSRATASRPGGTNASPAPVSRVPRLESRIVLEPPHLVSFTAEQRADLRLWHGRIHLQDRIRAARGYAWLTLAVIVSGIGLGVAGISEGVPPAVVAFFPPFYMGAKLVRRCRSLKAAGLRLRRVFLMPRARWVLDRGEPPVSRPAGIEAPASAPMTAEARALERAARDHASILQIYRKLSRHDRAALSDVEPTAKALLERASALAGQLDRLDEGFDGSGQRELDARIDEAAGEPDSTGRNRRLDLLRRQRDSTAELVEHRAMLARQFDSACLALGNLHLDLMRFRSSGQASSLSDLNNATQQARAVSRDIGYALEAADELRKL